MISRILYLVVIDILAVGVAMRRSSGVRDIEQRDAHGRLMVNKLPMHGTDFTRIISHSG